MHPGGSDLIDPYIGLSIDVPFEEQGHSKSAKKMIANFNKVGVIGSKSDSSFGGADSKTEQNGKIHNPTGLDGYKLESSLNFDYNQGMLKQIYYMEITKKEYVKYVEEPKHIINPVRDIILFETPYLEIFTKTPWYAIPLTWLPWAAYFLSSNELETGASIFWIFFGVAFWTLTEYLIHRFIFHSEEYLPEGKGWFLAHFLLHGIHHAFP